LARSGTRRAAGGTRTAPRRTRPVDNEGLIPVLARAVREVEAAAQRGVLRPTNRTKFQAVAQLMREERARVKADGDLTDAQRAEQLKRLDGVATILAKTAARDTSVIQLLAEDAPLTESTRTVKRDMMIDAGMELAPEELVIAAEPTAVVEAGERAVVPQPIIARQLANPFMPPDFSRPSRTLVAWRTGSCSGRCSSRSSTAPAVGSRRCRCPNPPPSARSRARP
jgi:hypothetical protein